MFMIHSNSDREERVKCVGEKKKNMKKIKNESVNCAALVWLSRAPDLSITILLTRLSKVSGLTLEVQSA